MSLTRPLLGLVLALALAGPASAATVGFSLPQLVVLGTGGEAAVGGSVSVLNTNVTLASWRVSAGLDYGYARQWGAGGQYSFFDIGLGAGLPIAVAPQVYLMPGLDARALAFVASPEGLASPAWGLSPRLTGGFKPAPGIAVELSVSHAFLGATNAAGPVAAGLSSLRVSGTYSF